MNIKSLFKKFRVHIFVVLIAVLLYFPFSFISTKDSTTLGSYMLFLTLLAIIWYTIETRRLRQLSDLRSCPEVFISLQPLETSPSFLNLVVQNIGTGPAFDLRFIVNEKVLLLTGEPLSKLHFIKEGLRYLAPGHKVQCLFYNLYGKSSEDIIPTDVSLTYKNVYKESFAATYVLDPSEYYGRIRIDEKPYENIEKALKSIHEDLSKVSTGPPNSRIRVVAYTKKEAEEEKARFLDELRAAEQERQSRREKDSA